MACAALAYAAVVAVLLAASRAGVAAAVLGIVLWLWLRRDRVEAALLVLVATVPAALVAGWAFTRPALVEDGASHANRVSDGAWFGLLLVVGAALVAAGARELARRPLPPARRRQAARFLRGLAFAVAFVTVVGLVANAGRIADEFRGEEVRNDPGRFASLSSNNRLAWWGEARDIFVAHPLAGAGANTFEVARKRYRDLASSVTQPHSVPLQFLAGTGLVGLALLLGLVAAAAAAAVGAVRRLEGTERDAGAALAVALALWLVHALVDYDWDFVAVTGPAFFAARRPRRRRTAGTSAAPSRSRRRRLERSRLRPSSPSSRPGSRSRACGTSTRRSSGARSTGPATPPGALGRSTRSRLRRSSHEPASRRTQATRQAALAAYRRAAAATAREPGRLVRARPLRVPPRRPLLGLRPPEPRLHARPGRDAVDSLTASSSGRSPG